MRNEDLAALLAGLAILATLLGGIAFLAGVWLLKKLQDVDLEDLEDE